MMGPQLHDVLVLYHYMILQTVISAKPGQSAAISSCIHVKAESNGNGSNLFEDIKTK